MSGPVYAAAGGKGDLAIAYHLRQLTPTTTATRADWLPSDMGPPPEEVEAGATEGPF
ncbi:hypothetical protein GCM10010273_56450 [Streptomyces lavendulocolor]